METETIYDELARRLGVVEPIRYYDSGRPYLLVGGVEHGGLEELCHAIIRDRAVAELMKHPVGRLQLIDAIVTGRLDNRAEKLLEALTLAGIGGEE